ncbi:hypothetical protein N1851_026108 [Merluccius polli]|uniref:Uncharacterized protein n=1 Tax=Merluccius polli TaxID=89951 RepID=A0AA47NVI5_MERPO|nr:hypothetical protein N1851_026108 [Merluccius polli]
MAAVCLQKLVGYTEALQQQSRTRTDDWIADSALCWYFVLYKAFCRNSCPKQQMTRNHRRVALRSSNSKFAYKSSLYAKRSLTMSMKNCVSARQEELNNTLELKRLEHESRRWSQAVPRDEFQVSRYVKMVPDFTGKEVEKYFPHFERVAITLEWPKQYGRSYCSVCVERQSSGGLLSFLLRIVRNETGRKREKERER